MVAAPQRAELDTPVPLEHGREPDVTERVVSQRFRKGLGARMPRRRDNAVQSSQYAGGGALIPKERHVTVEGTCEDATPDVTADRPRQQHRAGGDDGAHAHLL